MTLGGMQYQDIQKRNQLGRMRKKLAEKQQQKEVESETLPPSPSNVTTGAGDNASPPNVPAPSAEGVAASEAAAEAIKLLKEEAERLEKKATQPGFVTEDMKKQADKVCKVGKVAVTTGDGSADMSDKEKAMLNASIGNGKNQAIKAWTNTEGQELVIDSSVVSNEEGASAALVFSGCKGCKYTIKAYCAKIFVRHCQDLELIIDESCRVLTQTIEVDKCVRSFFRIRSRLCTLQVEQCQSVIVDIAKREYFGNGAMVHKGRDFGNDGMLIWAGCDDLRLRIGQDVLICDFGLEAKLDKAVNKERTQFKVHYDVLNKLISEKVTRLRNGFPSTQREEDEFERRENAQLQAMADRMGISIRRKEDVIGKKVKPNEVTERYIADLTFHFSLSLTSPLTFYAFCVMCHVSLAHVDHRRSTRSAAGLKKEMEGME
ncbi:unnamed protein product [Chrysoparadoxa australica]